MVLTMFTRLLRSGKLTPQATWCIQQAKRRQSTEIVIKNSLASQQAGNDYETNPIVQKLLEKDSDSLRVTYDPKLDLNLDPFSTECDQEFIDELSPPPEPTFNLAKYINQLPTLQRLVDLGVKLYVLEKERPKAEYLLSLDFDRDVKEHLLFFHRIGFPDETLGILLTNNIWVLKENIANLKTRIKFLNDYKFSYHQIMTILWTYPTFINYGADSMLQLFTFLEPEFHLRTTDIPNVVSNTPRLISLSDMRLRNISFCLTEEAGFYPDEIRKVVTRCPGLFNYGRQRFLQKYDLLSAEAGYSNKVISTSPQIFGNSTSTSRVLSRILYLKTLNMLQPDSKKPGFIPLSWFCESDAVFVDKVKTSLPDYYKFLKSL